MGLGLEEQSVAHQNAAAGRRDGTSAHPVANAVAAARQRSAQVPVGAPNVLVVEDNLVNQLVALEFLALLGVRGRLAVDGEEALAQCEHEPPDLVLMDIQMPRLDGLETTRRLRSLQRVGQLRHFPVIALSALGQESDVAASRAAGMDAHLVKPVDFAQLGDLLAHWLPLPRAS